MKKDNIIANCINVIAFLFSGFGSFLLKIAPPQNDDIKYAVGISSFLGLLVLLLVRALIRHYPQKKYKKTWLRTAIGSIILFIVVSVFYYSLFSSYTYSYPDNPPSERYIGGTKLNVEAQTYQIQNPLSSVSQMVADLGGPSNSQIIWGDSHQTADMLLTWTYTTMALVLFISVFCLVEGTLRDRSLRNIKPAAENNLDNG